MSTAKDFRKSTFKNRGLNADELRRRREEASVEIRKQKREDALFKRRNVPTRSSLESSESSDEYDSDELAGGSTISSKHAIPLINTLAEHCKGIYSNDLNEVWQNIKAFRKILSKGKHPPIDEVIKCGVVPRFVELLSLPSAIRNGQQISQSELDMYHSIQFEACWSLTNITFGTSDQTMAVVNSGAVPLLIALLGSQSPQVKDQAIWTLGNIIGDGPHCRDMLLGMNFVPILIEFIQQEFAANSKIDILRNSVWCMSNLCRGKPSPDWERIKACLPILAQCLHHSDEQILSDACWGIAYTSDGTGDRFSAIIDFGIVPRLIQLLSHESKDVQSPALRVVGNLVTGNDVQTQAVLDCNVLPSLKVLLHSSRSSIQREACWAISNIAAGTSAQVQLLIDADLFASVISLLAHGEYRAKKEACWAVSNATGHRRSHPDQVRFLVSQGSIKALCDFLQYNEPRMIVVALDAISNILEVGESDALRGDTQNQYAILVEEVDGLRIINDLQQHSSQEVYIKCRNIIDKFFSGNEDEFEYQEENPNEEFYFAPQTDEQLGAKDGGAGFSF